MKLDEGAPWTLSHHRWHRYLGLRTSPAEVRARAFAFFLLLQLVTSSNGNCDVGWTLSNGLCYNVTSRMSWSDARQACRNIGGSITAILSSSQGNDVYDYLRAQGVDDAWIGLNKLQSRSQWLWDSGDVVKYTNWAKNEPNNAFGSEYCTMILDHFLKWNDRQCNTQLPGICKQRGNCGIGWSQRNEFCYNATSPMSWNDSLKACKVDGGSITDIRNSSQEKDILQYLLSRGIERAWIGLNKADSQSQWRWGSGVKVTYFNWDNSEPNNQDGNENCVEIVPRIRTGWNDVNCNDSLHGLCTKRGLASSSKTPFYSMTNQVSSSILSTYSGLASRTTTPLYSQTNEVSSIMLSSHAGTILPSGNNLSLIPAIVIPLSLVSTVVATVVGNLACRRRFCFQLRSQSPGNVSRAPSLLSDGSDQYTNIDLLHATRIQHNFTSDFAGYASLVRSEDRIYAALEFTTDAPQFSSNYSSCCNKPNEYSLPVSLSPCQYAGVSVDFAEVPFQSRGADSSHSLDFVASPGRKPAMVTSLSEA